LAFEKDLVVTLRLAALLQIMTFPLKFHWLFAIKLLNLRVEVLATNNLYLSNYEEL